MLSSLRPGRVLLGLGCLLTTSMLGCQSVQNRRNGMPAQSPAPQAAVAQPKVEVTRTVKNDFNPNVSKLQAFNTHLSLGKNAARQGDYNLAQQEIEKALDVSAHEKGKRLSAPERAEAHRQLAKVLDHLGQFAKSEEQFHVAQKLAPNDPKVYNDLGYSYYVQGRYGEAELSLRKALKLEPNSPGIYTNLGLALAAAGKTDEALGLLSKIGGPAVGNANLGYMLASLGRPNEAKAHYMEALKLQPGLDVVKLALARLEAPTVPNAPQTAVARVANPANLDPGVRRASADPSAGKVPAAVQKASAVSSAPAANASTRSLLLP